MEFTIEGVYPVLRCKMDKGEQLLTGSGAMSWMTDGVENDTKMTGGLMGGLKRGLTGDNMFMNTYYATKDNQEIAFASSLPGDIIHIELAEGDLIYAQKRAYVASDTTVTVEAGFTKKLSAGVFGGDGMLLQKFHGTGNLFLESDGTLIEYELKSGEVLKVDQGHIFMFDSTVSYELTRIKGLKKFAFGGEGLFLAKLTGPGKVYLQTMPLSKLAGQIAPYITPTGGSKSSTSVVDNVLDIFNN